MILRIYSPLILLLACAIFAENVSSRNGCRLIKDESQIYCRAATYHEIQYILSQEREVYQHLHIEDSFLKKIDKALFDERAIPKLHSMTFINNAKLTTIASNAFENLQSLEKITLDNNKIKKISKGTFRDLKSLSEIYISDQITTVKNNAFNNLPNLKVLNVRHNSLKSFKGSWFKNIPKIDVLQISEPLKSFDAFDEFQNITQLFIMNSRITSISAKSIQKMTYLQSLILTNNKIKKINPNTFINSNRLKILDLGKNNLKKLPDLVFSGLVNLDVLKLNHNYLPILDLSLMWNVSTISHLDISNNQIELLTTEFLVEILPGLKYINLINNSFSCGVLQATLEGMVKRNITFETNCELRDGSSEYFDKLTGKLCKNHVYGVYCNQK